MRLDHPEQVTPAPDGRPPEQQPRWRRDFPIDWPLDEYRSRRDFTKFLGLTSFAFVVGQVWIALHDLFRRTRDTPVVEVARVDDVPVGGSVPFDYPSAGAACILVRVSVAEFVAFGRRCTHLSCPVLPQVAEDRFRCPCHNGSFDLRTGEPLAGPPRRPLPRIALEHRNGRVYAVGLGEAIV
jgi:nitrite reductase/ring-hydroxylating ferredoxin subunit